jgi:hypothetical protein
MAYHKKLSKVVNMLSSSYHELRNRHEGTQLNSALAILPARNKLQRATCRANNVNNAKECNKLYLFH